MANSASLEAWATFGCEAGASTPGSPAEMPGRSKKNKKRPVERAVLVAINCMTKKLRVRSKSGKKPGGVIVLFILLRHFSSCYGLCSFKLRLVTAADLPTGFLRIP